MTLGSVPLGRTMTRESSASRKRRPSVGGRPPSPRPGRRAATTSMPATELGGVGAQPAHEGVDLREVVDAHGEGVGGVHAVLDGEVVEQVDQGAALRPSARRRARRAAGRR